MKMAGLMQEDVALSNRRGRLLAKEQESGHRPGWGPGMRDER